MTAKWTQDVQSAIPAEPQVKATLLSVDDVNRNRAYLRWEAAGKPVGDGVEFWLAAEEEMLQGRK